MTETRHDCLVFSTNSYFHTMTNLAEGLIWACAGALLLALVGRILRMRRHKARKEQEQTDRGVAYALEELSSPAPLGGLDTAIDNLTLQATTASTFGEGQDSRAFDKGILEGIRLFLAKEAEATLPLVRLRDRLLDMVEQGEASESEISVGLATLEEELAFEQRLKSRLRVLSYAYIDSAGNRITCLTKYHDKNFRKYSTEGRSL